MRLVVQIPGQDPRLVDTAKEPLWFEKIVRVWRPHRRREPGSLTITREEDYFASGHS